ncbi:COG1361 S-layer family protein [Candidatus Woesearchaeota archaeon]|nr:COG1361 S-layer family protein [Candidatus Woesearchaeota archaeon]
MMKIKNLSVKKIVMMVLMVVIFALSSSAAKQGPLVTADILKYEPGPVEPGDIMEVYVSVTNEGTTSEAFSIEFVPEFPFSLGPGEDEVKTLAALPRGENAIVKFWINVDPKAPSEDRDIKFNYRYSSNPIWIQLKSPISIRTTGAILNIAEYTTTPTTAKPGDLVDIELTLRNSGNLDVRNVDVTLNLDESKFSTIGSGTSKRIGFIGKDNTENVKFTLIADTSTEIKVHSIPVTLKFRDSRGTEYTEETSFSLVMGAEPELMGVVDSTTISSKGRSGTVTLKVINRGIMDLKYLNMKLVSTDQYDVLSASNEAYIGNLDSDDFETVDFIIKPKKKDVQLKAIVDFKDPYNREYQRQFLLPLRVFSAAELGKGGINWFFVTILLLIVAGVGYWYYRRRKKKKKAIK